MLEPLNDTEWRVFRLLIRDLPDRELEAVEQQLQRELIHRHECDSSWARLLFTSLSAVDLQRADAEGRYERGGRVGMLRTPQQQSQLAPATPRKKTGRKNKSHRPRFPPPS